MYLVWPLHEPEDRIPPREQMQLDHWKAVYEEARRAWESRIQEIEYQQQRAASVLTANGLLLGLLGATSGLFAQGAGSKLPIYLFLGAIGALTLGLGAGALVLWPWIRPGAPLFLEAGQIFHVGKESAKHLQGGTQRLFVWLAESIAHDAHKIQHVKVIKWRRCCIQAQLLCFFAGAVLLVIALLERFVAS